MASPAYRSHTLNAYAGSGTSQVVTKPTGTADQDILIAISYLEDLGSEETITWPSGFAEIISEYNNTVGGQVTQLSVAWKLAGGSEPANYTISWTNSTGNRAAVAAYSGAYAADPIDDFAVSAQSGTATSQTSPTVTAAAADTLLIGIYAQWQGGGWSSFTLTNSRITNGVIALGDEAIAATGATGTRTVAHNDAGGRTSASVLLASQAAGGAATNPGWYGNTGGWF